MPETATARVIIRRALLACALVLVAAAGGCGRKLPPIQPGTYPPAAVKDLAFQLRDGDVVLTWSPPATTADKDAPAVGFKVLRSRQTEEEAQCATCPPPFREIGDVRPPGPSPDAITPRGVQYTDRIEPGYRYQYKVRSYSALGKEGRDSNVVHITR